ncbi:tail completion protein gp17 [Paludisphaera soli]|uniref:tail completion protein gp17 n=1 Tax=Paludisphaera soli TaxID=2712865 RepID=UPI0013EC8DB0|nr:DUF3168 domain-containing protein [Paludisphaera soli]
MFAGFAFATGPFAGLADWSGPTPDPGPTTLRQAVRRLLLDAPAVAALVGSRVAFAGSGRSDAYPRITYLCPALTAGRDLDGPDGTAEARVRVSCWSDDPIEAEAVGLAVTESLDGLGPVWVGSIFVADVAYLREYDLPEYEGDGGDAQTYQLIVDFEFDLRG